MPNGAAPGPALSEEQTISTQTRHDVDPTLDHTRRLSTETKASTKTTEFFVYVLAVVAVVVTAFVVGNDGKGTTDPFSALDAIRYITYLTVGYMVARGLAKSGSRDHYDAR